MYKSIYVYIYRCTCIRVCLRIYQTHKHTSIYIYIDMYTYIYIFIYMHTHVTTFLPKRFKKIWQTSLPRICSLPAMYLHRNMWKHKYVQVQSRHYCPKTTTVGSHMFTILKCSTSSNDLFLQSMSSAVPFVSTSTCNMV